MLDERIILCDLEKFINKNKKSFNNDVLCDVFLDINSIIYKVVFSNGLVWISLDYTERHFFRIYKTNIGGLTSLLVDIENLVYSWFK